MKAQIKGWLKLIWYSLLCIVLGSALFGFFGFIIWSFYEAATAKPQNVVEIVEQDGHKFAVVRTLRAVSMSHSPSCSCLQTNK